MSDNAARMAAYGEYLETYQGDRERHDPGAGGCIGTSDHCLIHHVDEPETPETYQTCGECCHVFVTEEDLQREDLSVRTQIWQAGLRTQLNDPDDTRPLNHGDAPLVKPGAEIYHCPLCAHDF